MNKQFTYQNRVIHYRDVGEGRVVVLIHGFGEDGNVWNNQVDYLKNKFRLIVPDLPGSGNSEMIEDMSMEGLADVIRSILETELSKTAFNNAAIIGHSMGGYVSLAFAEKYPELLDSLGLFHSTAFPDNEEKKQVRRKGIEFIEQHGAYEFLKTTTPNLFSPKTKEEQPSLIEEQIKGLSDFSPGALISYYNAMIARPDRRHLLEQSKVPVLFVMGEYDNAVPLTDGLKQCHLPMISHIHVLRSSGHMGMLEEPAKSNSILNKFLSN